MKEKRTIIYVNFAPYENAGKILDYILSEYYRVVLFSFNFHKLSKNQPPSKLTIFENAKVTKTKRLFQTPTPPSIAFVLLPIRSFVIFLQILWHSWNLKQEYGPADIYFTVNAFTAWTGNIIRSLGLATRTVFWIWDYYPPIHKDRIVMFMRWLYWQFDKPATLQTDRVVFLNRHLYQLRQRIGILPNHRTYPIIEIGTDPRPSLESLTPQNVRLVFLGVLKNIQGLDLFFDAAQTIAKQYPTLTLHIIGGGPDENHYRERAASCPLRVIFHGYVNNEKHVDAIIKHCHIGIAPYVPDKSNVMYYSDPSKIKRYLNFSKPIITTNVFDFSHIIKKDRAGILISYSPLQLAQSIGKILHKYSFYQKNATRLAHKIQYRDIYKDIFED